MYRPRLQVAGYYPPIIAIIYFFITISNTVADTRQICSQRVEDARSLVFVSTLDGKISALDANNYGQKQWSLDFNEGPMLSSSIHRRELNNNGQWVRLIPSLNGNLYKFDGETLEALPISTDKLLHSSWRYSDDLVFSGGKQLYSYGVSADTGEVIYKCTIDGCSNNTKDEKHQMKEDVLIIQRLQQTVRAVESRTGVERWNFSVGQHSLELVNTYCPTNVSLDIEIKVIIPEGLIWAVNRNDPTVKLWQYKFDSPIVTIWHKDMSKTSSNQGLLKELNLFDTSQWVWGSQYSTVSPSIYIGMHERQLYVQENFNKKTLVDLPVEHMRYPWQPYPAGETALISNENNDNEISMELNETQNITALSVLYNSEYINGNGFYLYLKDHLSGKCNYSNIDPNPNYIPITFITETEKPMITYTKEEEKEDDDIAVPEIIVSIWYWWKEILIISITSGFLMNLMLKQHQILQIFNPTFSSNNAIPLPLIVERHIETQRSDSSNSDGDNAVNNFKSRYLTDFEPVDCLGKGGYGIVFEAKNKIDDCNYAIKRIALPNSQDSRERVMREVKALAKLDHPNIVRYFNAWLECPPSEWQEEHDRKWIDKLNISSEFLSGVTETETKPNDFVCIDVAQTDPSSIDSACEAVKLNKNSNDDSFIVFESSNEKRCNNDSEIYIDDNGASSSDQSASTEVIDDEQSLPDGNSTRHSEDSIVFQETGHNITGKRKQQKRQKSFSLDLNNKSNNRKSAKMFLYIQMQLCQRLSLREWLKQTSTRDPFQVLNIFQQIVAAVEYVHLQGLIHRDLKPSNIFFAYDDKVKIGDFGLVTAMTESYDTAHTPTAEKENITLKNNIHTACVGTHLYMSPEQMNGQVYNYKVDIYSLGIIFFELLTPFCTEMERTIALSDLKKSIFPKDFAECYPAEYDLLKMMMDVDPSKRPTTLGIKARPPLQNHEVTKGCKVDNDSKWHFELPQLIRTSSVTSSSSSTES